MSMPMPGVDISYIADAESWTAHFVPSFHPLSIMLWGRGPLGGIQVAILVAGGTSVSGQWVFTNQYEYILEKAMAPHSSTLAWKIPWMAEPDRLQSMGSLRVGHD